MVNEIGFILTDMLIKELLEDVDVIEYPRFIDVNVGLIGNTGSTGSSGLTGPIGSTGPTGSVYLANYRTSYFK